MKQKQAVLSIAGFDPTGGAGILTDAAVIRSQGFHPLVVLTSVAAQGANQLLEVIPLPAEFVGKELGIVEREFEIGAIKIGMLYSPDVVEAVTDFISHKECPVVLDPVIKSSSRGDLILPEAVDLIEGELIPHCTLVTPNADEAAWFNKSDIQTKEEAIKAALALSEKWRCSVLLKGGHLQDQLVDIFVDQGTVNEYPHERHHTHLNLRGTGCALSTLAAIGLMQKNDPKAGVEFAICAVNDAIKSAYSTGRDGGVGFLEL
ncbi:hypothetical protein CEE37_13895 [candidate division LCP-89 bacterium B3_LCP]|uniref:hydroxymethylpyrimidine kinase n=1 Tax=candidate division LCP-89 bacterium B3_LCP TaxID=2012998 RepID=A0A532URP9_UNCL8|nr:MAG: hypothetical protein CEE37_13895 [candidate division LCP-89 bacterium B3_LCP]